MIELKGSLKERVDTPAEISGHILLENKKSYIERYYFVSSFFEGYTFIRNLNILIA